MHTEHGQAAAMFVNHQFGQADHAELGNAEDVAVVLDPRANPFVVLHFRIFVIFQAGLIGADVSANIAASVSALRHRAAKSR